MTDETKITYKIEYLTKKYGKDFWMDAGVETNEDRTLEDLKELLKNLRGMWHQTTYRVVRVVETKTPLNL